MPGTIGFGRTVLLRGETAGLNQFIHDVCVEDLDHILERFQTEDSLGYATFANWIGNMFFRGDCGDGRDHGTASCIDHGSRVKSYILFCPDSFDVWWEASVTFMLVRMDKKVFQNKALRAATHQFSRDVLANWNQVFANERGVKAILFGSDTGNGEKARPVATFITVRTKETTRGSDKRKET